MPVEVGDTVTLRSWNGEWIEVRIKKLYTSPQFGECVDGVQVVDDVAQRHVSLPLSHLIERAIAKKLHRGKWELTLPDGKVRRFKSKKAVQEYCTKRGLVYQED